MPLMGSRWGTAVCRKHAPNGQRFGLNAIIVSFFEQVVIALTLLSFTSYALTFPLALKFTLTLTLSLALASNLALSFTIPSLASTEAAFYFSFYFAFPPPTGASKRLDHEFSYHSKPCSTDIAIYLGIRDQLIAGRHCVEKYPTRYRFAAI